MDQNTTTTQEVDNDLQKAIDDITNNTNIDPVFSDPVAAPSSVPEGDTGELGEPVGPFPAPKPEPTEAFDFIDLPEPSDITPTEEPETPPAPKEVEPPHNFNVHQVKEAALRDLIPILDKINITPSHKFKVYKDIFETLKDYTVIELAYRAASEITDDTEHAEALLYLVDAIDKM